MVFVLSFGVGAVDLFDEFVDTAEIEYGVNEGEFEYLLKPLEYENGEAVDDGLDHELTLDYGIADNAEVSGWFYHLENYTLFDGDVKFNFYNENSWSLSGKAAYSYVNVAGLTSSATTLKFLSDKSVNDKLVLHNNFGLLFADGSDDMGKAFESGLTYKIDEKNTLKAVLRTNTFVEFGDMEINSVAGAYNSILDEKTTYTGIVTKVLGVDNIIFENEVEYKAMSDLTLTGTFVLNTDGDNYLNVRAEKGIQENMAVVGEFDMNFNDAAYKGLQAGINYTF